MDDKQLKETRWYSGRVRCRQTFTLGEVVCGLTVSDHKRKDKWAVSTTIGGKTVVTTGGRYWVSMLKRCDPVGWHQAHNPTYKGVRHTFENFSDFVEWASPQVGYHSSGFQLDKDLLVKGNKHIQRILAHSFRQY